MEALVDQALADRIPWEAHQMRAGGHLDAGVQIQILHEEAHRRFHMQMWFGQWYSEPCHVLALHKMSAIFQQKEGNTHKRSNP